jgi:hypothetical protein
MRSMIVYGFFFFVFFFLSVDRSQAQNLEEMYKRKLEGKFLKDAPWILDLGEAKRKALESGKPILAYFARSDAPCPPCLRLENEIFEQKPFITFANSLILYIHINSGIATHQDQTLLQDLGGQSIPSFMYLEATGQVLRKFSTFRFDDILKNYEPVERYLKVKKIYLQKPEDKENRKAYFLVAFELIPEDITVMDGVEALFKENLIPEAEAVALKQKLTEYKIKRVLNELRPQIAKMKVGGAKEEIAKLGKPFYDLFKSGYIPQIHMGQTCIQYWQYGINYGLQKKDKKFCEMGYNALKSLYGNHPQYQQYLNNLAEKIEKMR